MKNMKISAAVAAMALLIPAGAIAKKPEDAGSKGKGHAKKTKLVTANVTGEVTANDGTTLTVMVGRASGQAKACKGKALSFDISKARVHTADNDADGDMDAADVLVGHVVKVQGKVAVSKGRKTTCSVPDGTVLPAKQVHNRTTPAPEDDEKAEEAEETPAV